MSGRSALATTGFFRLWTAESVSMAGSQISMFAIPLVAVLSLDADAWEMGLLGAAGSLAILLFGLSVGVLADRYERRRLLILANVGRAVVVLVVPVLYWADSLSLTALILVSFVVGALGLLFDSAMAAYLPRLVGKNELERANSWIQGTESVGEVAGPGMAGLIVQWLSAPVSLLVDSVSYLVSSVALASLPKAQVVRDQDAAPERHVAAVVSGLKMLWGNKVLRPLALAAAHFNLFTAMFFALFTLYTVKVLGFSPFLLGAVTMTGGVAGLLGSAAAVRLSARFGLGRTLIACYAVPGLAGLLVPWADSFGKPVAAVFVGASTFIWTFCVVILLILGASLRQRLVADAYLGRVSATFRFVSWGVDPIGALLGGALGASAFGLRRTMVLAALGIVLSALWPWFSAARTFRTGPGRDEPQDGELAPADPAQQP
ncbi:MFS transporter [Streptomyces sp. NPDC048111]|uniref:MFS transporter n=1 Tax=Streptomyces sp. NPDC048111 TaxID=3365500 RepID=UPI00371F36DE